MQSENYKRLLSRLTNAASNASAKQDAMRNPILAYASPPPTPSSYGGTDLDKSQMSNASSDKPNISFEMEIEGNTKPRTDRFQRALPMVFLASYAALQMMLRSPSWSDFRTSLFKRQILLYRSFRALYGRFELILGSLILHILLGLLFAWVNETITPASVIAYFGIGCLFLMLANAQFVFYLFTNHHVSR
jgi:hypothetical protein